MLMDVIIFAQVMSVVVRQVHKHNDFSFKVKRNKTLIDFLVGTKRQEQYIINVMSTQKNDVTAFLIDAEFSKINKYRELFVFIVRTQRLSHDLSVLLQFRFFTFSSIPTLNSESKVILNESMLSFYENIHFQVLWAQKGVSCLPVCCCCRCVDPRLQQKLLVRQFSKFDQTIHST